MTVLANEAEAFIIRVMNFMIFVEAWYLMKDPMKPHIYKIINYHDENDCFKYLPRSWKLIKSCSNSK